jgi:hypothetical protein
MPDENAEEVFRALLAWQVEGHKFRYAVSTFGKESELHTWSGQALKETSPANHPTSKLRPKNSFDPVVHAKQKHVIDPVVPPKSLDANNDGLSCYEMLLYAALVAGKIGPSDIFSALTFYPENQKITARNYSESTLPSNLSCGAMIPYDLDNPSRTPHKGDLVFFKGASHVAMATGATVVGRTLASRNNTRIVWQTGKARIEWETDEKLESQNRERMEAQVLSFWPRATVEVKVANEGEQERVKFARKLPVETDKCDIERTTIEDLVLGLVWQGTEEREIDYGSFKGGVRFAAPAWTSIGGHL